MNKLLLFSIVLIFIACNQTQTKKPANVLDEKQMVEVIKDLQMIESMHKDIGVNGLQKDKMIDTSYTIVFNNYNIKASDFDSSLSYYASHPKLFEAIMDQVNKDLAEKK